MYGANLGDTVSHELHLGHWRGLLPLALALAATLLMERRAKLGHQAFYWLAIVIVRTAATNLADLATHDFRLSYGGLSLCLAIVLAALVTLRNQPAAGGTMPTTNGWYWAGMLVAGTLGTALGDGTADGLGLGVAAGSLLLCAILAAVFLLRARDAFAGLAFYWVTVVAVRTAGTTLGDFSADTMGLLTSTVLSGAAMAALLVLWSGAERRAQQPA